MRIQHVLFHFRFCDLPPNQETYRPLIVQRNDSPSLESLRIDNRRRIIPLRGRIKTSTPDDRATERAIGEDGAEREEGNTRRGRKAVYRSVIYLRPRLNGCRRYELPGSRGPMDLCASRVLYRVGREPCCVTVRLL